MKILKYKKASNGKYKIFLDDARELVLYEDVILKYELLLKKEIKEEEILEIEKFNQECDVYYVALNSIKSRFKSIYDTRCFLLKKEYPIDLVESAIEKLIKQGYLNDRSFAKSYINNQIITTSKGPKKIERELLLKKVNSDIILEELSAYEEDIQLNKIDKLVNKMLKSNHSRGGNVLKNKIIMDLNILGYENEQIYKVLNNYSFNDFSDIAKKEYDKLYKRLSKKYEGKELEFKIKEKLYQKGLYYEN